MDNKGIKITNHGETSVFVAISDGDKKTRVSAKSLEVKPGQTIRAGAAKGGMNDSNSSDLAQAGVRAEPAKVDDYHPVVMLLKRALGVLSLHDEPEARAIGLDARDLLAAPTIPAQVPAAEVRAQAMGEKAEQGKFAERLYGPAPSVDERRDALYTMALIFAAAESDSSREACFEDMYREFLAVPRMSIFDSLTRHTGAEISTNYTFEMEEFFEVEAVERVLAQSSTADKASEVRAAELEQEVAQLKDRLEKMYKSHFMTSQALHNRIVGEQSAWIEWQHGAGAESAMEWIHNGLVGPGLIPDEDEPNGKKPQAWFDEHVDDRYDIPPMKEVGAAPSTADSGNTDEKGAGK